MPAAFSVVIPTYNRAAVLGEALESVLAQTCDDWEAIIVDDGSTDTTAAVVARYGPRLRYFTQPNTGAAAARNRGIAAAEGRYVTFLDSDDVWGRRTLETFARAIARFDAPVMIAGHGAPPADRAAAEAAFEPALEWHGNFLAASQTHNAFRGTPGLAIRRDALIGAAGFATEFPSAEDQDLCLRLGTQPGCVRVTSAPLFFQRTDLDQLSHCVDAAIRGVELLVARERQGAYPGGPGLAPVRRRMICAAARRVADMSARAGLQADALRIYRDCFAWHLALRRWRFLLGFPFIVALPRLKPA